MAPRVPSMGALKTQVILGNTLPISHEIGNSYQLHDRSMLSAKNVGLLISAGASGFSVAASG